MSRYSYDDTRELASDVDAVTHERGVVDSFGRDVDDFERDITADSLDEFEFALRADVDRHHHGSDERSSPRAHVRASAELLTRVSDARRTLFDDAVTRYLARFVSHARAPLAPYIE